MNTLLLNAGTWDLTTNGNNSIALVSDPYSQAQDAASAIKTFQGEVYYDTTLGLPYWTRILGMLPPLNYLRAQDIAAAKTVPGVASAVVFFSSFVNRILSAQVLITAGNGASAAVNF